MHCCAQLKFISKAPSLMTPPPYLYNTGTGTFKITDGDYDFPLKQYCPTTYICLRRSSEEKLEHFHIIDITDEEKWEPYKASQNMSNANSTQISNSEGNISDNEYIDYWLLFPPDQHISVICFSKPKDRLTP